MLFLLSSLFGVPGGIPAFNQLLVRAAIEYAAEKGEGLRVVALTDDASGLVPWPWLERIEARLRDRLPPDWYRPCGGERIRCVFETLRALPRASRVLFGHVNLAPLGLLHRRAAIRSYGVIAHGTEVWSPLPWHRRLALRCARTVACVSRDTALRVETVQGVASDRCSRVINAVETLPPFTDTEGGAENVEGAPASALRLLSITRLHPGEPKGVDLMLRALAGLPDLSATYVVVGEGAARPALQQLAAELGLGTRVRFAGALDNLERDRELANCDVFTLPSSSEGFGIVYLEAMAHGKPCLAARIGGAPEAVLDEETGLLVEPTVEALREALLRMRDPALRRRFGAAGRQRVASHFSYDAFRQHAFSLFERLGLG